MNSREFELYNLEVTVIEINGECTCNMNIGDKFLLTGGKIAIPKDFCIYALQSTLPLLPAKQRQNHPADWMETDSKITCPDPACGLIMEIKRVDKQTFDHNDVSANKM